MRRTNAPTLQDVADQAGVTAMMASVVLNGARSSTRVSEATRARILKAADQLRYRRNAVAHGLLHRRMDTLGVVAVVDGGEINLYFLEVLNGILEAAAGHGQNTTVFSIADWKADEDRLLQFCDGRVDGMIFIAPQHLPAAFVEAIQPQTPFVMIHGSLDLPHASNLDVDNEGGGYAVTRHLLSLGHRRIAHLPGGQELLGAQQRLAGYRRALEEAGLPYDDALVPPGGFSIWSGRLRMTEMLHRRATVPLPTAIFCANDAIANGCMEALASQGLGVPGDISIAGFDDILTAGMTTPPLTTVRQPFREMGARAVELLLRQVHGEAEAAASAPAAPDTAAVSGSGTEIFSVELIVRESVGPPP